MTQKFESFNKLTMTAKSAGEQLAVGVMEDIDWDFLKNATDLYDCDNLYITWIISVVNDNNFFHKQFISNLYNAPYSIKDVFQKEHSNYIDVIDKWVDDNWEDYLDEDTVNALYDIFDIGGILGKNRLNGGRYESYREFQMLVSDIVIGKIKESLTK